MRTTSRSIVVLFLITALAGCFGGSDDGGDGDDLPNGSPVPTGPGGAGDDGNGAQRAVQTYTGGFEVVTPYGCTLVGGSAYDGTVQDGTDVDPATRGGPFQAYINVTTGSDLSVSIVFVDESFNVQDGAVTGASGSALSGTVPAQSTRVIFSACGVGAEATVWYQARAPTA